MSNNTLFSLVCLVFMGVNQLQHKLSPTLDYPSKNFRAKWCIFVNLIKIYLRFLHIFSFVVVYWHALEKTWPKQLPYKLSSKPKDSQLITNFNALVGWKHIKPSQNYSHTYNLSTINFLGNVWISHLGLFLLVLSIFD